MAWIPDQARKHDVWMWSPGNLQRPALGWKFIFPVASGVKEEGSTRSAHTEGSCTSIGCLHSQWGRGGVLTEAAAPTSNEDQLKLQEKETWAAGVT